jgi:hypothetical protein
MGSLQILYTNDASTQLYSPKATISDADAAKAITWLGAYYGPTTANKTSAGYFNAWANDIFGTLKTNVVNSLQTSAAQTAVSTVIPIVVTPNQ